MKTDKSTKLYDAIGPFTTIPNSVVKLAAEISAEGLALWVYLRYRTNGESGVAFPSYTTIQKDTGLSRQKIAKYLTVLEENGLLYKERRFGASSVYELQMPPVVPIRNYSSSNTELSVVYPQHTNKTDLNKTELEQEVAPEKHGRAPKEKTPIPDIIRALQLGTSRWPNKAIWETLCKEGEGLSLDRVRMVCQEWLARGYKPTNFSGILSVARNGWDAPRTNGNGHAPTTTTPDRAERDALAAETHRRMLAGEI